MRPARWLLASLACGSAACIAETTPEQAIAEAIEDTGAQTLVETHRYVYVRVPVERARRPGRRRERGQEHGQRNRP